MLVSFFCRIETLVLISFMLFSFQLSYPLSDELPQVYQTSWHGQHILYSFSFATDFPFQVISTWLVWPKACTATSQSLWPLEMGFRAVWHQWTWMDACQTSSMMPFIGADRSSVDVKVQPIFFLVKPEPCCKHQPSLLPLPVPPSSVDHSCLILICHVTLHHHQCPLVTGLVCQDMCHRLQECMLADVFWVSHTCQ